MVEEYENGVRDLDSLLAGLMERWHVRAGYALAPADWTEVYRRCESMPEDDCLFWVYSAEDRGLLTVSESNELLASIETLAAGG